MFPTQEKVPTEEPTEEINEKRCNCCKTYNQFCVKYISQMAILGSCIIYSLIKLSDDATDNREFWSSLLSFSLGIVVPHPTPSIK